MVTLLNTCLKKLRCSASGSTSYLTPGYVLTDTSCRCLYLFSILFTCIKCNVVLILHRCSCPCHTSYDCYHASGVIAMGESFGCGVILYNIMYTSQCLIFAFSKFTCLQSRRSMSHPLIHDIVCL